RGKRRTIAPESSFLQRESEQVEPVADTVRTNAMRLAQDLPGQQMARTPGAPRVDADDQQMPARPDAARRFTQHGVRRQAEIQAMLEHHHIGGMLGQWPGLLFADYFDTRHRRAQAHAALDLLRFDGRIDERRIVHQITAEAAFQLVLEHPPLLLAQLLAQWSLEPGI